MPFFSEGFLSPHSGMAQPILRFARHNLNVTVTFQLVGAGLLRNSRKTECGAKQSVTGAVVRAAPLRFSFPSWRQRR